MHRMIGGRVVLEAQKFRTSGIDPEFEGKLDQMFMGIVATGDKEWAHSSNILFSDFFKDVNNEIPEENEEENVRNDIHILNGVQISNDVHIDGNGQKRKTPEISSLHFKTGRKKSSKQIGGVARLSNQIEKLCNAANNMSQATSSLTPFMDPYGAIDGTHIAAILPPNEQVPYIGRKGKYYLLDSGYPQMKGYLGPYRGQREVERHLDMPSYSFEKQTMIIVATMMIHNFIQKYVDRNDAEFMEYEDINRAYENIIDSENAHGRESGDDDGESINSSGFEMELTRDAITSNLMNSL
ncbi:hypothetical protein PVK06_047308 [Gossypium arboreum]|uniref:Nuclease HARBI1 n=1 Tax=Gossypium arboreum TaxID=29729 RepID=A0ABR0MD33_GOSAR|nr:hypothetical protein PVK06_047308 [Gossypium arboreum]